MIWNTLWYVIFATSFSPSQLQPTKSPVRAGLVVLISLQKNLSLCIYLQNSLLIFFAKHEFVDIICNIMSLLICNNMSLLIFFAKTWVATTWVCWYFFAKTWVFLYAITFWFFSMLIMFYHFSRCWPPRCWPRFDILFPNADHVSIFYFPNADHVLTFSFYFPSKAGKYLNRLSVLRKTMKACRDLVFDFLNFISERYILYQQHVQKLR